MVSPLVSLRRITRPLNRGAWQALYVQAGSLRGAMHALCHGFMHARKEGAVDASFVPDVFVQNALAAIQLACENELRGPENSSKNSSCVAWLLQFELLPRSDGARLTPDPRSVATRVAELNHVLSGSGPRARAFDAGTLSVLSLIARALGSRARSVLRMHAVRLLATLALLAPSMGTWPL